MQTAKCPRLSRPLRSRLPGHIPSASGGRLCWLVAWPITETAEESQIRFAKYPRTPPALPVFQEVGVKGELLSLLNFASVSDRLQKLEVSLNGYRGSADRRNQLAAGSRTR